MNDHEVRTAVRDSGLEVDSVFREDLENMLADELAGRGTSRARVVAISHRTRRGGATLAAVGFAAAAAAVAGFVLFNRDAPRTVPATTPTAPTSPATAPANDTTVTSPPAPTSVATSAAPSSTTAPPDSSVAPNLPTDVLVPDSSVVTLRAEAITTLDMAEPFDPSTSTTTFSIEPDGTILALNTYRNTAELLGLDGALRWSITIPPLGDARAVAAKLGPDQILYVLYGADFDEPLVAGAVPATGPNAGAVVQTWETQWVYTDEECCGAQTSQLAERGLLIGDTAIAPYVDDQGVPSGATLRPAANPQVGPIEDVSAPGSAAGTYRAVITNNSISWQVEVRDIFVGDGVILLPTAQPDGSAMFQVQHATDDSPSTPFGTETIRVLLRPDGTVQQFIIEQGEPEGQAMVRTVASVDGQLYAVVQRGVQVEISKLVPAP
jgi:hypothetical protein